MVNPIVQIMNSMKTLVQAKPKDMPMTHTQNTTNLDQDADVIQLWHKLPVELRLTILELRLLFPSPITYRKHVALVEQRLLPLVLTGNAKLAAMAKAVYYRGNVFQITAGDIEYKRQPSLRIGSLIRHLEFRFQSAPDRESESLEYLWQPASGTSRSWQTNIPKLKTLRVVLDARGYWRSIFDGSRVWKDARITGEMLVEWERILMENVLSLTPEDITFEIEADGCPMARPENVYHDESSCTCKEDLETKIKGWMVKK